MVSKISGIEWPQLHIYDLRLRIKGSFNEYDKLDQKLLFSELRRIQEKYNILIGFEPFGLFDEFNIYIYIDKKDLFCKYFISPNETNIEIEKNLFSSLDEIYYLSNTYEDGESILNYLNRIPLNDYLVNTDTSKLRKNIGANISPILKEITDFIKNISSKIPYGIYIFDISEFDNKYYEID